MAEIGTSIRRRIVAFGSSFFYILPMKRSASRATGDGCHDR